MACGVIALLRNLFTITTPSVRSRENRDQCVNSRKLGLSRKMRPIIDRQLGRWKFFAL
ncbi:MAG: hypothetical protein AAGN35_01385 [Bacteroidota bacterium]